MAAAAFAERELERAPPPETPAPRLTAPPTDRFEALFGDTLEVIGTRPEDGDLAAGPTAWIDLRARAPGVAEIALRDPAGGAVRERVRVVVQEPGPRELPPLDATATVCVGDRVALAIPLAHPAREWARADPSPERAPARQVLGPLRPSDGRVYADARSQAPQLVDPQRARDAGATGWSMIRFVASEPGFTRVDFEAPTVLAPGAPLVVELFMVGTGPVSLPLRRGDVIFVRHGIIDPSPDDPIPALEGL